MLSFIYEIRLHALLIVALVSFPLSYLSVASWECERAEKKAATAAAATTAATSTLHE